MNIANKITVFRILLIPFFILFLLKPWDLGTLELLGEEIKTSDLIALVIFGIASLTDWIDGYLARKYNLVTNLGKFLDPLADKLLMTAGFVALIELDIAPSWIIILILSRELAITGFRTVAASSGIVIAAGNLGKLKTVIQIITIIVLILNFSVILNTVALWASAIITVISGLEYFIKNKKILLIQN